MTLPISIRGIRQFIPAGYFIGRLSLGRGPPELVPTGHLVNAMLPTLFATVGPASIATKGAGITNTAGTLSVEWNGGTVNALGTGLSISSGTLNASNPPVTIAAHSLFGNPGTVSAAGTSVAVGTGLTLTAGGTLNAQWNGGTVATVGTGLSLSTGTIKADWNGGTIATLGANMSLSSGTLNARSAVLPMVTGATPGPELIADPSGQCVGGPL